MGCLPGMGKLKALPENKRREADCADRGDHQLETPEQRGRKQHIINGSGAKRIAKGSRHVGEDGTT